MKLTAMLTLLMALATVAAKSASADTMPTPEEMWRIIQAQQKEIEALKKGQQAAAKQAADADEKAEAAVVAVEESTTGASGNWADRTSIGGYGELHYNNIDASDPANDNKEIDFHRFVLFFGHEFTDDIRFFSELELEHALSKDTDDGSSPGEVELEQAYIEFDLKDNLQAKGGQIDAAIDSYREILRRRPVAAGVKYNIGLAFLQQERIDEAATMFEYALADCANYQPGANALAACYDHLGEAQKLADLKAQWGVDEEEPQAEEGN